EPPCDEDVALRIERYAVGDVGHARRNRQAPRPRGISAGIEDEHVNVLVSTARHAHGLLRGEDESISQVHVAFQAGDERSDAARPESEAGEIVRLYVPDPGDLTRAVGARDEVTIERARLRWKDPCAEVTRSGEEAGTDEAIAVVDLKVIDAG